MIIINYRHIFFVIVNVAYWIKYGFESKDNVLV